MPLNVTRHTTSEDEDPQMSLRVTPSTPKQRSGTAVPKTPRTSKKAQAAIEQARREDYARRFFDELNRSVFEEGIPTTTVLKWSNRLLTTAGRARWRR